MSAEQTASDIRLPESLSRQLREFEKRLCVAETAVTVFGGLCGFLLTYLLLFAFDRFWNTPWPLRVLLTVLGTGAAAWFAGRWLKNWWLRRRDSRDLARLLQSHYSSLGDRLLGVVELANGASLPGNVSPALCRAAIRQVAEESAKYDFRQAVAKRAPRISLIACVVLAAAVLVPALLFPQAALNALARWAKPLSPVERYTFVRIEDLPEELVVPHGEDFEIVCSLAGQSRWRPPRAACRFENQPRIECAVERGKAVFRVPGQVRPGVLSLRIGDLTRRIAITPAFRPELARLAADIALPSYLGLPGRSALFEGGRAEFLEGSTARFTGTASRELRSASIEADINRPLSVRDRRFVSAALPVNILSNRCAFTWTDCLGLGPSQPCALSVAVVPDEAPRVDCKGVDRVVAILEEETVKLQVSADDDYGVRELWINWKGAAGAGAKDAAGLNGTQTIAQGTNNCRELAGSFSFSPIACNVPEETAVTLCAYATDYYPGRKPSMSTVHRVYVLSRAKHAKLIQEQMDLIRKKLEDRTREEERLLENNTEIGKRPPEELAAEKTAAEVRENEASEANNAAQLANLAKSGENLLKEALRNKDISENVLRQWSGTIEAMNQLAGKEMKQAAGLLQQAAADSGQRSEKLKDAVKMEQRILDALRGMEKELNKSIEDMLAKSLANRLLFAAAQEKEIGTTLAKQLPDLVGADPARLKDEQKDRLEGVATKQDNNRRDVSYIQDDIAGFYSRTRIKRYGTVQNEMEEKKAVEELAALAKLIRGNIGIRAIEQAAVWHTQLKAWAELLAPKKDGQGGSGDSAGDNLDAADMEILIALLRARQREEMLREQTRLLDQGRNANRNYAENAKKLSDMQNDLAADVRALERRSKDDRLRRLVDKVEGEMMNAGMFLRRPQTDVQTIAIETEIIELLSNHITSGGQCGSGMQALMLALGMKQAMGAGAGPAGGGSTMGGTTDRPNAPAAGSVEGQAPEQRDVEKAGGADSADWPEEFKEVLDAYFKALEEKK